MIKTKKPQTTNSKFKTSRKITKITKAKQLVNAKVATRRSARLYLRNQLKFGELSVDLQSKIGWEVLKNFNLNEQLKLRTISPAWDYNVQLACKQVRSLMLEFDKTETNCSNRVKILSSIKHVKKFIIKAKQWNHSTNAALGKLFCNVERLNINYTVDSDNNELLFNLFRYFPKVTSFTFNVATKIVKGTEHFAGQLFGAIADHLAPLTSLNLNFQSIHCTKVDVSNLSKILPFLQNLTLFCPIENYHELLEMMGTNLPAHFPINSLSLRAPFLNVSKIAAMFKKNPALGKIKRLHIMDIDSREVVDCLLDHFTELECLEICVGPELLKVNDYSVEWMKTFSKLAHLKELVLIGMHPRNFDYEMPVTLPNVRRLTFCYPNFWASICSDFIANAEIPTKEEFEKNLKDFAVSLDKQYPNLEELANAGLSELHDIFRGFILSIIPRIKTVQFNYFERYYSVFSERRSHFPYLQTCTM